MTKGAGKGRTVETVDPSTGEVLKGVFAFVPEKHKSPFGKDWFAVAQDALNFLAQNRRYLGEEGFAVFCALASRLDFENYILVNQAEVARSMEMDRGNVNKAIKRLEELGILTRGPKSGVSPTFMLNPGWLEGEGPQPLQRPPTGPQAGLAAHRRRQGAAARPVQRS